MASTILFNDKDVINSSVSGAANFFNFYSNLGYTGSASLYSSDGNESLSLLGKAKLLMTSGNIASEYGNILIGSTNYSLYSRSSLLSSGFSEFLTGVAVSGTLEVLGNVTSNLTVQKTGYFQTGLRVSGSLETAGFGNFRNNVGITGQLTIKDQSVFNSGAYFYEGFNWVNNNVSVSDAFSSTIAANRYTFYNNTSDSFERWYHAKPVFHYKEAWFGSTVAGAGTTQNTYLVSRNTFLSGSFFLNTGNVILSSTKAGLIRISGSKLIMTTGDNMWGEIQIVPTT